MLTIKSNRVKVSFVIPDDEELKEGIRNFLQSEEAKGVVYELTFEEYIEDVMR